MKRLLLIACVAIVSCSKKDNYKDISAVGIDYPTCPNKPTSPRLYLDHEYSFDVTNDSISVYTEDNKFVGTVKLEGQLDSLIILDNQ
jgi:hypothetical protein